ncbi:hypothetical protein F7725_026718, partial [Dissostichus mawsoni]
NFADDEQRPLPSPPPPPPQQCCVWTRISGAETLLLRPKSCPLGTGSKLLQESDENLMYMNYYHAWIGLYKNTSDYWAWSNEKTPTSIFPGHDTSQTMAHAVLRFYGTTYDYYYYFYCHEQHGDHLNYIFIPQSKTWSEAQQYCRSEFDDLATFRNTSDLHSDINEQDFQVWTGLHRDGETWRWSTGVSDYRNWALNETGNDSDCVSISFR